MGFMLSSTKKYKCRQKNSYIEYDDGSCAIICSCGDEGTLIDVDFLDSIGTDPEARKYLICPKCFKPLLEDLQINHCITKY